MEAIQNTLFDYAELDTETRIVVQQRVSEGKALMKSAAVDLVAAGGKFAEVRDRLRHNKSGGFDGLLKLEGLERRTVYRLIQVWDTFGNRDNLSRLDIGISALYVLAAPETPESARQEAISRAEEGETITHQLARGIIHDHRSPAIPFVPEEEDQLTPYEQSIAAHYDNYPNAGEAYKAMYQDGAVNRPYLPDVLTYIEMAPGAIPAIEKKIAEIKPANHQLINASTNNEWYTPRPFLDAAHEVMGGIDLDPASNPLANQAVRAEAYYTIDDDGFAQPWGDRDNPLRVWLNPPYGTHDNNESNQSRWSRRLIDEYRAGNVSEAILLVNAVTGNGWFQALKNYPICFPDSRIRFYNADTEAGQPTHSNALVYFGPNVATFVRVFSRFGAVMARLDEYDGHVFIHGLETSDDNDV